MSKPVVSLERNNADNIFVGVTYFDSRGFGVRAAVLSSQGEHVAEAVMVRRFHDMKVLMEGNAEFIDKIGENYEH